MMGRFMSPQLVRNARLQALKMEYSRKAGPVTTKYFLEGIFSGPLTPLTGGGPLSFKNANFKNLIMVEIQKEEG